MCEGDDFFQNTDRRAAKTSLHRARFLPVEEEGSGFAVFGIDFLRDRLEEVCAVARRAPPLEVTTGIARF
jgi:hypothetical protein